MRPEKEGNISVSEYLTLYPGIYLPEELEALSGIQAAIDQGLQRAKLTFEELKNTSDGRDRGLSYRITVTPEEVQARMRSLDPENPRWFEGDRLPAPETWSCPKGGYFGGMNKSFGDETCVKEHHHNCRFLKPVYQGDTLYPVLVDQQVWDATPYTGSEFRTWALRGTGFVYNQRGELVVIQTCGVEECFRIFKDPSKRTWQAENIGITQPEFQNHPIHHYTQEDWETIRKLWAQEQRRGDAPLYWEDVKTGDQPPVTVDGPYSCPGKGGMIMSVSYPSQSDWYIRSHYGDPSLQQNEFGVYHNADLDEAEAQQKRQAMEEMMRAAPHPPEPGKAPRREPPKPPKYPSPVEARGKATFDNYTGRDSALRAIRNWIGNQGDIVALSWCIGAHGDMDQGVPCHPNRRSPFLSVPGMEQRHTEVHGEEGDLSINRLYVTGKRIDDQGDHLVDLTWWCETITGQIHTEGTATVRLPSR
jgi:hypothetical protein